MKTFLLFLISLTYRFVVATRVHFFYDGSGTVMDGGFNQMVKESLDGATASEEINSYSVNPVANSETVSQSLTTIDNIIAGGATPGSDIFVFLSFAFDDLVAAAATKYDQFYFIHIDSCYYADVTLGLPAADNVVCVLFQEDQVAFAAGYAAAKVSKTGVVGGVFGAPLGPLLRFEMGYKSGARYADPDVVVETQYVHAFDTPDKGAEVAEFMVTQRNADVIFGAAGGTSLGTLNWCLSNQVLAIGVDQDQFHSVYNGGTDNSTDSSIDLSYLLTSAEKGVDSVVKRLVKEFVQGILPDSAAKFTYTFDYENDGIRLSDWHLSTDHITLDEIQEVRNIEKKLAVDLITTGVTDDKLDLFSNSDPFTYTTANPFAAPPSKRFNSASAMVVDPYHGTGVLVVFGGTDENGNQLSDLWEYTVFGNQWEPRTTDNLVNAAGFLLNGGGFATPPARTSSAMAEVTGVASYGCCGDSGSVFMWGGYDGGYKKDGWVYTRDMSWFPAASQWTKLPEFGEYIAQPSARHSHCMASVASSTYMFGGKDTDGMVADFWLHEFPDAALAGNETVHRWTALEAPGAMSEDGLIGSMMIADADFVYLLGGETGSGIKVGTFYKYDASEKTWIQLASTPVGISFGLMALMGDGMIFVSDGTTGKTWVYEEVEGWYEMSCGTGEGNRRGGEDAEDVGMFATNSVGGSTSTGLFLQFGGKLDKSGTISNDVTILITNNKVCERTMIVGLGGGKQKFPIQVVVAVIGVVVVFAALLVYRERRKNFKSKMLVVELQSQLNILQSYSEAEVKKLEMQIRSFETTMQEAGEGGVGSKDLRRLLINAHELVGKEIIGKGSFGEVFKSDYRGQEVAVKVVNNVTDETLSDFQKEIFLTSGLRHQNVVSMIGCCWEKELMGLVLEYCDKGMSSAVLRKEGATFHWDDPLVKWVLDVSRGMTYLHGISYQDVESGSKVNGILHRDLKPDNCLVTETYGIKISDFGESRAVSDKDQMTQVGTPIYIAPEIVKGDRYTSSADVFSFALTMLDFSLRGQMHILEYLTMDFLDHCAKEGLKTQNEVTVSRLSTHIIMKGWRPNLKAIELLPRSARLLIEACWQDKAEDRPAFKEIVEFVNTDMKEEVMGTLGDTQMLDGGGTQTVDGEKSTNRRTSTSGALAVRIKMNQLKAETLAKERKRHENIYNEDKWGEKELRDEVVRLRLELKKWESNNQSADLLI